MSVFAVGSVLTVFADCFILGYDAVDYPIAVCIDLDGRSYAVLSVVAVRAGSTVCALHVAKKLPLLAVVGHVKLAVLYLELGRFTVRTVLTVLSGCTLNIIKQNPRYTAIVGNEKISFLHLEGGYGARLGEPPRTVAGCAAAASHAGATSLAVRAAGRITATVFYTREQADLFPYGTVIVRNEKQAAFKTEDRRFAVRTVNTLGLDTGVFTVYVPIAVLDRGGVAVCTVLPLRDLKGGRRSVRPYRSR